MNVIITTENSGKLEAATRGFEEFASRHQDYAFDITAVAVESGVSDTPLSDEEGVLGCENRIKAAELLVPDGEMYVALEGVLAQVRKRWYVRGWTMIKDVDSGRVVTACGAAVEVPQVITDHISAIDQFSAQVKRHYAVTPAEASDIRNMGANGVFSGGEYTRRHTFFDGVRICLAQLANERNWVG